MFLHVFVMYVCSRHSSAMQKMQKKEKWRKNSAHSLMSAQGNKLARWTLFSTRQMDAENFSRKTRNSFEMRIIFVPVL